MNDIEFSNLSKNICQAIKTRRDVDAAIRDIIKEALSNDISVRTIIEEIVHDKVAKILL